jgi:hypothetical protein
LKETTSTRRAILNLKLAEKAQLWVAFLIRKKCTSPKPILTIRSRHKTISTRAPKKEWELWINKLLFRSNLWMTIEGLLSFHFFHLIGRRPLTPSLTTILWLWTLQLWRSMAKTSNLPQGTIPLPTDWPQLWQPNKKVKLSTRDQHQASTLVVYKPRTLATLLKTTLAASELTH